MESEKVIAKANDSWLKGKTRSHTTSVKTTWNDPKVKKKESGGSYERKRKTESNC